MSSAADAMRDRTVPAMPKAVGHKDAPDSIRALAAATVVVSHAIQIIWFPHIGLGNWTHWTNSFLSDTAVIIFFVLSGYLISASIYANIIRHGHFRALEYALSRAIRIYPPLLFAAVLSGVIFLGMWLGGWPGIASKLAFAGDLYTARETISVSVDDLLNTITMRNGLLIINGPLWSLYVEVKLYAVAGLVSFCAFGAMPLLLRLIIAGIVVWLGEIWSLGIAAPHWVYCAWWAMGAGLFLAGRLRDRALALAALGPLLAAGLVMWLSATRIDVEGGRVLFVLLLSHAMFFRWTWSEPVTKSIAGFSYTLYLVHFPILIFAYAAFVRFTGPEAPATVWRFLVMGLGMGASFLCAWWVAAVAEDTTRIRRALSRSIARAKQGF